MTSSNNNNSSSSNSSNSNYDPSARLHLILDRVYRSCADDPYTSVHRAWSIALVFTLVYFSLSMVEMINIHTMGGSRALVIAAVWTGVVHLAFSILGTFILKRFPTSFAIGFLLGLVLVLANQNLVLGGTFYSYRYGVPATNQAYGSFAFILFFVLTLFGGLLFQFKKHVIVAPIDAKGAGFRRNAVAGTVPTRPTPSSTLEATSPYQSYDKDSEASDL